MDRIDIGHLGSRDNLIDLQVTVDAPSRTDAVRFVCQGNVHRVGIGLTVHSHRLDTQFTTGSDDSKGDFAPIGYQYLFEHR